MWTFRRLAEGLLRRIARGEYSYDAAFKGYEREEALDPAIRWTAYLAGRDFISRYYTLARAADAIYGGRPDARTLADLWIYYFGGGYLEEGERKRYSKKIARSSPRGRLPDLDEIADSMDEVSRIAFRTSYPRWLVADLLRAMGPEAEAMLSALNEPHRWLRVNLGMTDVDSAVEALRAEGVEVERHRKLDYMLLVLNYEGPLSRLKAVSAGYVVPQDVGSALVAEEVEEGEGVVLDACSAPGGKAAILLMRRSYSLVGCDVSIRRIRDEARLLRSWGLGGHRYELVACDARLLQRRRFDASILDAPCTNSGDAGRNPGVKLMLENKGVVRRYARLQRKLLEGVLRVTRGTVVYSTCSVLPEEGELVVRDMELEGSRIGLPKGYMGIGNRVYPHVERSGGFFVSRVVGRPQTA